MAEDLVSSGLTVLLVERSDSYHGVKNMLEAEGHEVVEVETAQAAFENAIDFTGGVRPDVILLNGKSLPAEEISILSAWHSDMALDNIPLLTISSDVIGSPIVQDSDSLLTSADGDNLGQLVTKILNGRYTAAAVAATAR